MIKVDVSAIMGLGKAFDDLAGTVLGEDLKQGAFIAGAEIQREARALVPVDTGALKISIENSASENSAGLEQTVGPTQPYGKDIEFGRSPGTYVSPAALMGWAKRKGLNAYAVSKSIQRKGSPAQPYLFPAAENKEPKVLEILSQAVTNAINRAFASVK